VKVLEEVSGSVSQTAYFSGKTRGIASTTLAIVTIGTLAVSRLTKIVGISEITGLRKINPSANL
jgi:hypothetical protein